MEDLQRRVMAVFELADAHVVVDDISVVDESSFLAPHEHLLYA